MSLNKYSYNDYINDRNGKEVVMLDDVSKHIVIVFDSEDASKSNDKVYEEFHYILDNISLQYKKLTGVLPRFNLVGHSRGGITNVMYATEHPYNVASMYSMGAPYNGSKLGEVDALMDYMEYMDNGVLKPGAASIMDKEGNKAIRDAWNQTLLTYPDAEINAVAFGSITSLSLVSAMLSDVKNNTGKYGDEYSGFIDTAEVIVDLMSKNVDLTDTILNVFTGIADVANFFGYDACDALVSSINSSLKGQVTYDDVRPVVDLIQKVNGQIVILDDLFIDVNSQLGFGFDDGGAYNGFARYVKTFTEEDYSDNRAIANQPGIVHNLEIMNSVYINKITSDLICGVPIGKIIEMDDKFSDSRIIDEEGEVFSFVSQKGGTRTFVAEGCKVKLYCYDEDDCLTNIYGTVEDGTLEVENTLTFNFSADTEYLLFVTNDSSGFVNVTFSITNRGTNKESFAFFVASGQDELFTVTVDCTGFYLIKFNGFVGAVEGLTGNQQNGYYAYFQAGKEYDVYLYNSAVSASTVIITITEPSIAVLNNETPISLDNRLMKYVNDTSVSMAYNLELNGDNADFSASVYDASQNLIANVTTANTKKTYSFILGAEQTCYIAYSGDYTSLISKLYYNTEQLRWKINDELFESTKVQLPRGYSYVVELVSLVNDQVVNTEFVFTDSGNFTFVNSILTIANNALVGYDVVIYPVIASEYLLTIEIGFGNDFEWSISNGDIVYVNWSSQETSLTVCFSIINSNGETTLSTKSKKIEITSYLPKILGTTTVRLKYIVVDVLSTKSLTFTNGTEFLNVADISVNNLFDGDNTTLYYITCFRHLNNIRYNTWVDRTDDATYTNGNYKLMNDITLSGYWTPIPNMYKGEFEGNNKNIYNLKINVGGENGSYGLFSKLSNGIIKNLTIRGVTINSTAMNSSSSETLNIGTLVGFSSGGLLNNCHVYGNASNKSINVSSYLNTYVGGLVGFNSTRITNSSVNNIDMTVSSNAGGIAGINLYYEISDCMVSNLHITYVWNTENACLGGVVGINSTGGTVTNCSATASNSGFVAFTWYSPNDINVQIKKTIYPSMGFVIGKNRGTYSGLSWSNLKTDIDYHWRMMLPKYD